MAVSCTNTTQSLNTDTATTWNAATVDTVNGTEVFTITPAWDLTKTLILFKNGAGHGAFTYSVAVGGTNFPHMRAAAAKTGSVADGKVESLVLDGQFISNTGTFVITLTPATGKKLLSDHAAEVAVVCMP